MLHTRWKAVEAVPLQLDPNSPFAVALISHVASVFGEQNLLGCSVIGSRANGYATAKSDLDLHVILDDRVENRQLGLWKETILTTDCHFLAVTQSTLRNAVLDTIGQPMENSALTLFRSIPLHGAHHFSQLQSNAAAAELVTTKSWLRSLNLKCDTYSLERLVSATIIRKLIWAPPLVERFARKIKGVGIERAYADTHLILSAGWIQSSTEHSFSMPKIKKPARIAMQNLRTLASRHGHVHHDSKAMRNGLIYGLPYLIATLYESLIASRYSLTEILDIQIPEDMIVHWMERTASSLGIARARSLRNRLKDYIV
jgi:hypothetical protein